jgi:predicted thioesterase
MTAEPGQSASVTMTVTDGDTAIAVGSGDVPVLATPMVVVLAERAAVRAIAESLAPGQTTVGSAVQLTHVAACPVGTEVSCDAVLESVEGRRLTFKVSASDDRGLVAAGYVTRVVVERDRFLDRSTGH